MRAILRTGYGGPDVLDIREIPSPNRAFGGLHQPEAGQRHARLLGQAIDDQAEQPRQRVLAGHVQQQPFRIEEEGPAGRVVMGAS
jgi:hypothetical protein